MEERDVSAVSQLFRRYMERFDMIPLLIEEDIRHEFLSGRDTAERGASTGQVAIPSLPLTTTIPFVSSGWLASPLHLLPFVHYTI
jgi:hypothetical protein